jgi:hypothetical protein
MSGHPAKLTEHYRDLAEGEVARAKLATTNEARADHYARAAEHLRLANAAEQFGFSKLSGLVEADDCRFPTALNSTTMPSSAHVAERHRRGQRQVSQPELLSR